VLGEANCKFRSVTAIKGVHDLVLQVASIQSTIYPSEFPLIIIIEGVQSFNKSRGLNDYKFLYNVIL